MMAPGELLRSQLAVPLVAALSSAGGNIVLPVPELLIVGGVTVPIVSAIAGMLGVLLGELMAAPPAAPLTARRRWAVRISLHLLIVGIVVLTGQQLLVALGWGIGLGFSGLAVAETLGSQAMAGIKMITDALLTRIAGSAGGKDKTDDS
ncbi:hypothetical protein P1X14_16640 [Sphingomonas sp. AOB5]|uniref:hypothetical protein n=1 Tax=Sphingomonas sp. AOB5 TaxID=3034017 RepID=UPI0023F8519F|nr:hypothetical protein [Sphingomonas sp. AOB5]MDF7776887.1 hypothetical protein [Sphingomonas sp. AOB5]